MVPNFANQYLPGVIQIPSSLVITAITNSNPAIITTVINPITEANTYIAGMCILLNIPQGWGMTQANKLTPTILSVSGNNFTIDLNTINMDAFTIPSGNVLGPASFSPNGSRNYQYNNNSSPVPFQSLNNIGN